MAAEARARVAKAVVKCMTVEGVRYGYAPHISGFYPRLIVFTRAVNACGGTDQSG
jgi:hypothetical protein